MSISTNAHQMLGSGLLIGLIAIWWSLATAIRYSIQSSLKNHQELSQNKTPFYESIIKLISSLIVLLISALSDFYSLYYATLWFGIILSSIVEIMIYFNISLPDKIDIFFKYCLTFTLMGFNLLYIYPEEDPSLYSTSSFKIHYCLFGKALACSAFGVAFFGLAELFNQSEILFSYGRVFCFMLNSSFRIQIGICLYKQQWLSQNYQEPAILLFDLAIFCLNSLLICVFLIIELAAVKKGYTMCSGFSKIVNRIFMQNSNRNQPKKNSSFTEQHVEGREEEEN
jgi:hypothetical protein